MNEWNGVQPTEQLDRWTAVLERDETARPEFVYAVVTTGIYCRAGCSSRRPKRDNVRFFDDWPDAESAGFRPCKRCTPRLLDRQTAHASAIAQACRRMDEADELLSLDELAADAGLSPFHFHRLFKQATGITPNAYARQRRAERLRTTLQERSTVTDALYDAGYASSSRMYDEAGETLGMSPRTYQQGGPGETIQMAVAPCSLGYVVVAATERGICHIGLGDSPEELMAATQERFPQATLVAGDDAFSHTVAAVVTLIDESPPSFDLPLDIQGTAFQQQVWAALRQIPPGTTATYSEIAAAIGKPNAVRAVAGACAANKLAVIIPCHRVVRSDGGLGGYRWGVERKEALLAQEVAGSGGQTAN